MAHSLFTSLYCPLTGRKTQNTATSQWLLLLGVKREPKQTWKVKVHTVKLSGHWGIRQPTFVKAWAGAIRRWRPMPWQHKNRKWSLSKWINSLNNCPVLVWSSLDSRYCLLLATQKCTRRRLESVKETRTFPRSLPVTPVLWCNAVYCSLLQVCCNVMNITRCRLCVIVYLMCQLLIADIIVSAPHHLMASVHDHHWQ